MPATTTQKPAKRISRMAKAVVNAVKEAEDQIEDEIIDDEFEEQDEQIQSALERDSHDVFFDCGKKAQEKGLLAEFIIKKNGERICTKIHPYSWEKCHKEFGPGMYDILARARGTGVILGRQSQMLGTVEEQDLESNPHEALSSPQGLDTLTFFKLMNESQAQAKAEARDTANQQQNIMAELFKTVLLVNGQKQTGESSSTVEMMRFMMEMQKSNMEMLKQVSENTNKLFEKLNDRVNSILTQKPKDEFGPLAVMKMLHDAESKGMNFYEKMMGMVEKKAEEKAELLAAAEGDGEEEKGLTGLLKGFLPIISNAVAKMPTPAPQPNAGQLTVSDVEAVRRQEAEKAHYLNLQRQEAEKMRRIEAQGRRAAQAQSQVGKVVTKTDNVGLPTATLENSANNAAPGNAVRTSGLASVPAPDVKAHIKNVAVPILGQALLDREESRITADKIVGLFERQGISRKTLLENFTLADILTAAREFPIPDAFKAETDAWFKDFHGWIERKGINQTHANGAIKNEPLPVAAAPVVRPSPDPAIQST